MNSQSKLSLGEGPISDKKAAQRVNAGTATATVKNGQVYVQPAVTTKMQQLNSTVNKNNTTKKSYKTLTDYYNERTVKKLK